jgi:hypothetical protein
MSYARQNLLNVLILGDTRYLFLYILFCYFCLYFIRTGKSSLVKQYIDESCSLDYTPTMSSECIKKDFYFDDNEITLQVIGG